jgi:hypothetical protein
VLFHRQRHSECFTVGKCWQKVSKFLVHMQSF